MNRRIVYLLFALAVSGYQSLCAQSGLDLVGSLPDAVGESSGLLAHHGRLITHNDSGNEPVLFELDSADLRIVRQVRVTGHENTDWEDLASDAQYLYIADIGNNLGTRMDLKVLRVSWADFLGGESVTADVISYRYEDQEDFGGGENSDWDAEALVVRGDSLLIFTKQWQSQGTAVYRIPKIPGDYTARPTATYSVNGLITGAAGTPDATEWVLLGYSAQLQPFLLRVPEVPGPFGFPPATQKVLTDIGFGQAEGIGSDQNGRFFVSTETFSNPLATLPGSVYTFRLDEPAPDPPDDKPAPDSGNGLGPEDLVLFRQDGSDELWYEYGNPDPLLARAVFDTAGRRVIFENAADIVPGRLNIGSLGTSVYYFTLYFRGATLSRPFIRY